MEHGHTKIILALSLFNNGKISNSIFSLYCKLNSLPVLNNIDIKQLSL